MKDKKRNIPRIPVPFWILPLLMALLCEVLLHIWTMEYFVPGRFAAIAAFSLGFGGILALLCSLLPAGAGKWAAVVISLLLVVLYIGEYLINDAFQIFMAMGTVQAGAGGVVSTYLSVVFSAIAKNWWRILLLLLPVALYAVFGKGEKASWAVRGSLLAGAVVAYLAAFWIVDAVAVDREKLKDSYNFDSAVRSFGLNTALWLEVVSDPHVAGSELEFEIVETTQPPVGTTVPDPSEGTEETQPTQPPVVYGEHTLGLDFGALAEAEENRNVAALHSYLASLTPAKENAYTGLFAGKNLIFITAEAFTGVFIDPELTPTLYRLATQGIQFTDYYQPLWGASTTGGEYSNLVGQVPADGSCMREAIQQDLFMTIGNQLQALGYSSAAFHNNHHTYYDRHETHTYLGYDYFMGYGNGIEEGVSLNWPQSDLEMIDYTVPLYIGKQPFSVYYMSVSGHSNYSREGNDMSRKNYDKVAHLDCSEAVKCYIAANLELENALTSLLAQLEEAGILDDTVIVVAADHYPYGLKPSSTWDSDEDYLEELFGQKVNDFVRDQNTLIIWSGAIEDMDIVVEDPVYSLDILPTLSNLFGVEYDSRLFVGRDVFSEEDALVMWPISGSWKTDKGSYLAATGEFIPAEGVQVDEGYVERIKTTIRNKLKYSKGIAYCDYFDYVSQALEALSAPENQTEP